MKRKISSKKIIVDWDTSNSKKILKEQELSEILNLNTYKRGSLERRVKTIELAKKLKRSYKAIYNRSVGYSVSRSNRNRYHVDWDLENSYKPYTVEEMIMLSKVAVHKRAEEGSVISLAIQYGRTPWAMTTQISQLRKSGDWKKWLEVEEKKLARA